MDDFDREIKTEFITEALMNLDEAEASFMELESSSDRVSLLDKIFRLAHNLKGGSRAVGFGDVAEFTHELENLVQKIQKGQIPLTDKIVTILLRSNDRLVEMLSTLKGNFEARFNNSDLLQEINSVSEEQESTPSKAVPAEVTPVPQAVLAVVTPEPIELPQVSTPEELSEEELEKDEQFAVPLASAFETPQETPTLMTAVPEPLILEAPTPTQAPAKLQVAPAESLRTPSRGPEKEDEVVRVGLSKIDDLNDYVGEMIVLQSVIQQQSQNVSLELQSSIRTMMKLSKNIQGLAMGLRMLPVKPLIQKLQRVVRDTAKSLGKEVRLDLVGDHIEIDKSVLDRLGDPLVHILRNAVDHGLENTQDRIRAGKSEVGVVKLSFAHEGNHLIVEVSDDGKGINGEVLRKKAIEKKLISETQSLSERQILHLIFHAGFSTKTETSEISGRGVGMDVVKTNIEKIGGQVEISTKVGSGSLFRLQIPLSLAVIEGLVVTSQKGRYVVPLTQVQETINLNTQKVHPGKLGIGSCFELRGTVVPIIGIEEALYGRGDASQDATALIVLVGDQMAAVVVKDILRAQQIVVKPLGNGLTNRPGWVGCCVLGDGLPTLILSLVELLAGRFNSDSAAENRRSA